MSGTSIIAQLFIPLNKLHCAKIYQIISRRQRAPCKNINYYKKKLCRYYERCQLIVEW